MIDSAKAALFLLFAVVSYGVVVQDSAKQFLFLSPSTAIVMAIGIAIVVGAAVIPALVRTRRSETRRVVAIAVYLLVGAFAALAFRTYGYERIRWRSESDWARVRERDARARASRIQGRFVELCQAARAEARELSMFPAVEEAVEHPDVDGRGRLFDILGSRALPVAHAVGTPGVTVYDRAKRPLAWSGENVGLLPREVAVTSSTRVFERGTEILLVATEGIRDRMGTVAIEVPLIADRQLGDPYQLDFDALSSWAGVRVIARFAETSAERAELEREVRAYGSFQFQQGLTGGPRWRVALGCDASTWLVSAELEDETVAASETRARESWATPASIALALAALAALVALWQRHRRSLGWLVLVLTAVWASRLVLAHLELPLGFGLDLDNPAHFATSLVYGLARSPIDFLLTLVASAASSVLIAKHILRNDAGRASKRSRVRALAGATISLALLTGATWSIGAIWLNSSLDLTDVQLVRFFPPLVVTQVGLLLLVGSASLLSYAILARAEWMKVSQGEIVRILAQDAALVVAATLLLSKVDGGAAALAAAPLLLAVHLAAIYRSSAWQLDFRASSKEQAYHRPYRRLGVGLALLLSVVAAVYPALVWFEDRTVRSFVETTVAPSIRQYQGSQLYVMAETARAIDRAESEGAFVTGDREGLAYRLWVGTELAVSAMSSSITILDETGEVVSRFSLNFPWIGETDALSEAPEEWIVDERPVPGVPEHPGFFVARRSFRTLEGSGEIRVRVAFDFRNLPFFSTLNPYLHLFRTTGIETARRFPYQELELSVFRHDGTVVFSSTEGSLSLDDVRPTLGQTQGRWFTGLHEDQRHNTYLFDDDSYRYAVSYPKKPIVAMGAELAGWALLAIALGLGALAVALALGYLAPRELLHGLVSSFYGKLYVAFVLIALVPLISLAFFLRGVVARQLGRDAEQEGTARARVVGRLVADALPQNSIGGSVLTDGLLDDIGALTVVDVDVYLRGDLVATSKRELFTSGLLRPRAQASTYRDIVVDRASHAIHRQAIGALEYVVASVPLSLGRTREPAILSVPLASRQPEIARRVETLNQAVLLAAFGFALAAAWVANSLARRIAGPVAELTEATHHIAEGELDVELHTRSSDEIGRLFTSFTQMTADLKRQRNDLERTKKLEAWAEMARQVAHEIKNPLTPIQLSAEHLRRVFHDPDVNFEEVLEDCSSTILEQVKTLRQISMEFSTFASPEPPRLEPSDLAELVRATVAPYAKTPPNGVAIALDCDDDLPTVVLDRRLMKRTLVNLIENAIHALSGDGRIVVRVRSLPESGEVELAVTDDGPGVDPEIRERVFEPYFSTRAAGTGLGLAIAKKVVDDHGGTIALDSERGEGTTVRITLRAHEGVSSAPDTEMGSPPA